MSDDWLERQLARELAPVAAPDTLGIRLGFSPPKRWEFPRVALAVAAAVVMIIGGGYAASRTAALDLRQGTAWQLHGTATARVHFLRQTAAPPAAPQAGGDVPPGRPKAYAGPAPSLSAAIARRPHSYGSTPSRPLSC